jgi:HEPN domain-containing protein
MPPGLFGREEAQQWLVLANEDLASARLLIDAAPPLLKQALFHCQQAVEKA